MITIYTVAYNEEYHIQYMINHYKERFPNCHIVVYDNYSDDNTVKIAQSNGAEVILFDSNNTLSDLKHIEIKNNCWKNSSTDWVLTCDVDELLNINETQLKNEELLGTSIIKSEGYDMVNFECYNTLETITHGVRADRYDKYYLFNKKLIKEINYEVGCHEAKPSGNILLSSSAYKLYHYRYVSVDLSIKRYKSYSKRLSQENIKNNWGIHYIKTDQELLDEFNAFRSKAIKLL